MAVLFLIGSCHREHVAEHEHSESANLTQEEAEHIHAHEAGLEHTHTPAAKGENLPKPPPLILRNLSTISVYTFDPAQGQKGKISYELLEPARTRIVITEKDDPDQLYRILLWDWQEAGKQTVEWDGTDQSGWPLDRKACSVRTSSIAKSVHHPGTRIIKSLTTEQLVQGLQGPPDHSACDAKVCKPMELRVVGIGEHGQSGGNASPQESVAGTTVSGIVTLRVEAAKDARGYGDQTGYGVRWMVDQQLVAAQYYEKESDGKFSYALDTTAFQNGEHVLRISTCDHYDHIGLTGIRIVFDNR
jgi:hypothetical protein